MELPTKTPMLLSIANASEEEVRPVVEALRQSGLKLEYRRVRKSGAQSAALEQGDWQLKLFEPARSHSSSGLDRSGAVVLATPLPRVCGAIGANDGVPAEGIGSRMTMQPGLSARPASPRSYEQECYLAEWEQCQVANCLRFSEQRLFRLARNTPDIIFEYLLHPRPHFTYIGPAALAITGYSPEEHYGNPGLWADIVESNSADVLAELLYSLPADPPNRGMMCWRHRDGSLRWVEHCATSVRDGAGKPIGIEGIVRDITDRMELEVQLQATQRMEAVGHLAGGIAHDFNNMLTVISGFTSILRRHLDPVGPHVESLAKIDGATQRSADLVRQLLTFSRRQARTLRLLEFNRVVADFVPMLRRLIGENIRIDLCCGEGVGSLWADRSQLEQVLMNLAVNARDAMADGGVLTIATQRLLIDDLVAVPELVLRPGHYVQLAVTDTGSGMSQEVRKRIFEPLFTTKGVGAGTGLGLSTVHGIVMQMGGGLYVHSEEGLGTTFRVYLPADTYSAFPDAVVQPDPTPGGTETLLLVEDEELVRDSGAAVLAAKGYTVWTAEDGVAALAVLEQRQGEIDLLLTDSIMPRMGGPELAQRVANAYPDVRVLFTTGYSEVSLPPDGVPNGDATVLQKPYSSSGLLEAVRHALDRPPAAD